jgi:uncharacterized protein DUF3866
MSGTRREHLAIRRRWAVVVALGAARPGAVELTVDLEGTERPALAYPELVGDVRPGDRVLLNTTATTLGLGTGGFELVIAVDRPDASELAHPGRVMKARYTPMQIAVQTVEETHRDVLDAARL